ncbi:MAG TPA: L-threonylcarbamoyladenylate synthase [Spirochaetia bacterium]|nr:L-threonylcarbamoyladenylate synthase [Spirochaetia bacterium]
MRYGNGKIPTGCSWRQNALETLHLKVDALCPAPEAIEAAAALLRRGALVAFPTETVYGLGASALDDRAVARIFTAKGRPADNPLIVHVADPGEVPRVAADLPEPARVLMEAFWPGPLTLVLPRREDVSSLVAAGLPTVAVRMPDHPVALALIRAAGVPVAAPSANLSGRPSPTSGAHVLADLAGRIEALLDAGACALGVESTVLDLTEDIPAILRPGGVTAEELAEVLGGVPRTESPGAAGKSPGTRHRHYAPAIPVYLVEGERERVRDAAAKLVGELKARGLSPGVLCAAEHATLYGVPAVTYGRWNDAAGLGRRLYGALRELEERGAGAIVAEGVTDLGLGRAVMDRLRRAAHGRIILV